MCGIVGYKGNKETGKILLRCIKNLEYRGYDSIGMAVKNVDNIDIRKDIGKIDFVNHKVKFEEMKGNMGIAHTRWATTGEVTKENSHPHTSGDNTIFVVHNGIIENYQELKEWLIKKGINFNSQTDSEVVPQMISWYITEGNNLFDSINATLKRLEGSFALAIISSKSDNLFFARRDSPLVIGIKENKENKEFFLASDIPAFLEYTNKAIYLENEVFGFIDKENIHLFKIEDKNTAKYKIEQISWGIEEAKKGNF